MEIFRREKELEKEDKQKRQSKQDYRKPKSATTRFHNFEQRTEQYSSDEINKRVDEIAERKRREYLEGLKQQREGGLN